VRTSFLILLALPAIGSAAEPDLSARFDRDARPLLTKYCGKCHGAQKPKGGVDLSGFTDQSATERSAVWYDALAQLKGFAMPPAGGPQPTPEERKRLLAWLEATADRLDDKAPRTPGRVPPRRLTRAEYNNTIRDLTGLDFRPADDFPPDDTAYGFDTVADALTLPPLLFEKYLAAAEKVLDRAIVPGGPAVVLDRTAQGKDLEGGRGGELKLEAEAGLALDVPHGGDYEVRVSCGRAGPEGVPATAVLKIDGVDSAVWAVTAGANKPADVAAVVSLRAGTRRLSVRHTWHTATVPKGQTLPDIRLAVASVRVVGPQRAVAHKKLFFAEPGPGRTEREAARAVIERFTTRAFRRPATAAEIDRLTALYDRGRKGGKGHVEAARVPLLAILVSPHFLFRVERGEGPGDAAGAVRLADHELASRLSYFLWSGPPDDELLRLAAAKKLHDDATLKAQVRRMLADPRASALAENFAGQWLGLRRLETAAPDPTLFRGFGDSLRRAMAAEVLMQFEAVVREDRSVLELLHADYAFLNEDLARHYGVKGVSGPHMRKVALADPVRGGVVTTAAVLTLTSHPTRTSPVKRGKWLLDELLGAPPPAPPPDVPELEEAPKGRPAATTLRERLERHRADPKCFGCHVRMDALGLGLENFDAVGRWRDRDGGKPVNAAGELPGGEKFASPAELKQVLLAHKGEFGRCLTEKVFVYALGRGMERSDRREVKRVAAALAKGGWRFSTLATEVVLSYPFRYRLAPGAPQEKTP
jgi:hypothetical protein